MAELAGGAVRTYTVHPEDVGLDHALLADLKGGATPQESAAILRDVLGGTPGPKRSMLLINSGAALYVAGKAETLKTGVERAAGIIDSGAALEKLDSLIHFSQNVS